MAVWVIKNSIDSFYCFMCHDSNLCYMQAVAASFCFTSPPKVNLNIDSNTSKFRKKMKKVEGSRNGFGEKNPYGRKGEDESRQFVRY